MGYYFEQSSVTDYPVINVFLELYPNYEKRASADKIMQKIHEESKWEGYKLGEWSGICQEMSMKNFLAEENHVESIKNQFLKWIEDIKDLKMKYPGLPWE